MGKVIDFLEKKSQQESSAKSPSQSSSATSEVTTLSAHQNQHEDLRPIPGHLIWLHCPTCGTKEYTELQIPGGRVHRCGTLVEEVEVPIDVRAEYTIALRNIEKIQDIEKKADENWSLKKFLSKTKTVLQQMKSAEQEYQRRLRLIAGKSFEPYAQDWIPDENQLKYTLVEPFKIMITHARNQEEIFPKKS